MAAFRSSEYGNSNPADGLAAQLAEFRARRAPLGIAPLEPAAAGPEAQINTQTQQDSPDATQVEHTLSDKQLELLRRLAQSDEAVAGVSVDQRVLHPLIRRGLAEMVPNGVQATEAGREYFRTKIRRRRRVGHHRATVLDRADRADVIVQAVNDLEQALPGTRLLQVGDLQSDVSEVLAGLRAFAEEVRLGTPKIPG